MTHLAILYADHGDRRKSPIVLSAAIGIFANPRDRGIKSPISGMSDIGDLIRRHSLNMAAANNFFASLSLFWLFILVRAIFKRHPMEPGMKRHIVAIGKKKVCP